MFSGDFFLFFFVSLSLCVFLQNTNISEMLGVRVFFLFFLTPLRFFKQRPDLDAVK